MTRWAWLLVLAGGNAGAADWVSVAQDRVRSVELDRASVMASDGGSKVAWGRIVLSDNHARTSGYKSLHVLNRYDCANRSFSLVKRVYYSADARVLREEDLSREPPSPVRPGTADERFFLHVCPQPVQARAGSSTPNHRELLTIAREAGRRAAAASSAPARTPPTSPLQRISDTQESRSSTATQTPVYLPRPATVARSSARSSEPATPQATPTTRWSYDDGPGGPDNWSRLSPANRLCGVGTRQSPIDIRDGIKVDQEAIRFEYRASHFRIMDNGHTIQVAYGAGSRIGVMGREYELEQIHFHTPSEERVNGRNFDMGAHLVHRDAQGRLAVVAVLLERGEANPLIQTLWNNLPLEKHEDYAPATPIQIGDLLPREQGYYAYMGSLTTPPCTEGVLWLVMKQPVQLSAEQIGVFQRFYLRNARPVQPLNGRIIKESR